MMRIVWLVTIFLGLAAGLNASRADASVFISGRVLTSDSGTPVAGVGVELYPTASKEPVCQFLSLVNGSYVLQAPTSGRYRLAIDGNICHPLERTVDVGSSGIPSLDLPVVLLPGLHLKLTGQDGRPLTQESVQVWVSVDWMKDDGTQPADIILNKQSSPEGTLDLPAARGLGDKPLKKVDITLRDINAGCLQSTLRTWPDGPITLQLQKGLTLGGTVIDVEGKPVTNAAVTATRITQIWGLLPDPLRRFEVTTNSEGRFQILALFSGSYEVRVTIPGAGAHFQNVDLSHDSTITVSPRDPTWIWKQSQVLDKG